MFSGLLVKMRYVRGLGPDAAAAISSMAA
jgi:hypothetical protein